MSLTREGMQKGESLPDARMERDAIRQQRDYEKEMKRLQKREKEEYFEYRFRKVDDMNRELREQTEALREILEHTLTIDNTISFKSLRPKKEPQFLIPPELSEVQPLPILEEFTKRVKTPSFVSKLLPGWQDRHQNALYEAEQCYQTAINDHVSVEQERIEAIEQLKTDHEIALTAYNLKNAEIDQFEAAYKKADVFAVESYNTMVLDCSEYPDKFPQEFRVAYVSESKQLIIDYQLPSMSIVPNLVEYKYVKAKDEIQSKPRKPKDVREQYEDLLMAVTLRSIHEVFEADQEGHLEIVTFNAYVEGVDAATGKDIRPYLISLRTTKDQFNEIDLAKVDKKACLRNLGAQISANPTEVTPVKPVVQFNMYDKRFVEHSDILSELETRPNLYDLNPFDFEKLICNLFEKMGFESKLTRSSKDGGVDVIAFDPRPILGGKLVIQAKRYRNTVAVSDVRDLWGTMDHERAHKGILVATSGFSPDAYKFADEKPIELIDGAGLLHLLGQVGIPAKIIFPDESKAL